MLFLPGTSMQDMAASESEWLIPSKDEAKKVGLF